MSEEEIPVKRGRGRPKGSRNKASIDLAQELFDVNAATYAQIVLDLAQDDKVPATVRLAACKLGLGKALADEKEKAAIDGAVKRATVEDVDTGPKIFMKAAPAN